jgi:hypothetical protein
MKKMNIELDVEQEATPKARDHDAHERIHGSDSAIILSNSTETSPAMVSDVDHTSLGAVPDLDMDIIIQSFINDQQAQTNLAIPQEFPRVPEYQINFPPNEGQFQQSETYSQEWGFSLPGEEAFDDTLFGTVNIIRYTSNVLTFSQGLTVRLWMVCGNRKPCHGFNIIIKPIHALASQA